MMGVFMGFSAHLWAKFQVLGSDSQFQVLSSKFRVISDSKLGTRHLELGTAVRGGRLPPPPADAASRPRPPAHRPVPGEARPVRSPGRPPKTEWSPVSRHHPSGRGGLPSGPFGRTRRGRAGLFSPSAVTSPGGHRGGSRALGTV